MSHEDRRSDAPTSAAGDSIILHVPACVRRFSSRRRIVSRLRALARRNRGLPEPEAAPLKLQVEENPDWPAAEEEPRLGPADRLGAGDPLLHPDLSLQREEDNDRDLEPS